MHNGSPADAKSVIMELELLMSEIAIDDTPAGATVLDEENVTLTCNSAIPAIMCHDSADGNGNANDDFMRLHNVDHPIDCEQKIADKTIGSGGDLPLMATIIPSTFDGLDYKAGNVDGEFPQMVYIDHRGLEDLQPGDFLPDYFYSDEEQGSIDDHSGDADDQDHSSDEQSETAEDNDDDVNSVNKPDGSSDNEEDDDTGDESADDAEWSEHVLPHLTLP